MGQSISTLNSTEMNNRARRLFNIGGQDAGDDENLIENERHDEYVDMIPSARRTRGIRNLFWARKTIGDVEYEYGQKSHNVFGKTVERIRKLYGTRRERRQQAEPDDFPMCAAGVPIFVPRAQLEEFQRRRGRRPDANGVFRLVVSSDGDNNNGLVDLTRFDPDEYPIEDCDERARLERAREIAEGVEAPANFSMELVCATDLRLDELTELLRTAVSLQALSQIGVPRAVHSQMDFVHCLVPDLTRITSCSFYWGKMDRYAAEKLLENKPEGTFLLRDSAQEEYLFSVSFRKYGRSLHARIEQWNHRFSFDSHDPGVYSSPSVCGLIEHYKDPTCCMFFEPMLTIPLDRTFTFSLQHLCRAAICDSINSYEKITFLPLPKKIKSYLKEYHYKQRVRVRKFDQEQ